MSVTNYLTMNGMIVHENRSGVQRDYAPDTLGSTAALVDSSQTITDRWEYWPYGEVSKRSGAGPTPFTFVGMLGYFKDKLDQIFYVRARHLKIDLARWLTVDPLWPDEEAYVYADTQPASSVDPSGHQGTLVRPWPTTTTGAGAGAGTGAAAGACGVVGLLLLVVALNRWDQRENELRRERRRRYCDKLYQNYKGLCGDFNSWVPCVPPMGCNEARYLREKYKMCSAKRKEFKKACVKPADWDNSHDHPIRGAESHYKNCLAYTKDYCGD